MYHLNTFLIYPYNVNVKTFLHSFDVEGLLRLGGNTLLRCWS